MNHRKYTNDSHDDLEFKSFSDMTLEEKRQKVAKFNVMDDTFFQKMMEDREVCEEILQIILKMQHSGYWNVPRRCPLKICMADPWCWMLCVRTVPEDTLTLKYRRPMMMTIRREYGTMEP